jgi:inhibitor of the pro-sigma K processing machinery
MTRGASVMRGLEWLAWLAGAGVLTVVSRRAARAVGWLLRAAVNSIVGMAALLLWDRWAGPVHLGIGVNPVTAMAVGVLGAPGFVVLVTLKWLVAHG